MPIIASTATLTIESGASVSNAMPIAGDQNVSIWMPDAWTAAGLTLQVARTEAAPAAGDWRTVADLDGAVLLPAAANLVLLVPGSTLLPNGARWLRVLSGTVAAPVNQDAARTIVAERRSF